MGGKKKRNSSRFAVGNAGYGLRNAADEPDAGARANECPPVALAHARTRPTRVHTHTHAHTPTHTYATARTHARTAKAAVS